MELDDYIGKIICGDCLEIMKQLPDKCVDLVFTSPPYNMRLRIRNGEYTEREWAENFSKKYQNFHDALSIEDYYKFHKSVLEQLMRISRLVFWNIQIVTGSKEAIFKIIGDFSKELRDVIVWDKGNGEPAMSSGVINRGSELIFIFENDGRKGRMFRRYYFERGTMPDIWRLGRGRHIDGNSACFNIGLPKMAINGWSKPNDIILDPFAGSGTTCVAAELLGRKWIGIEISPEYCKIAEKRVKEAKEQFALFETVKN